MVSIEFESHARLTVDLPPVIAALAFQILDLNSSAVGERQRERIVAADLDRPHQAGTIDILIGRDVGVATFRHRSGLVLAEGGQSYCARGRCQASNKKNALSGSCLHVTLTPALDKAVVDEDQAHSA